jgi:hypothetical protein
MGEPIQNVATCYRLKFPHRFTACQGTDNLHIKVPVAAELLAGILILQVVTDGSCHDSFIISSCARPRSP